MTTPAHDLATYIATNIPGVVFGTNLFVGDEEMPTVTGQSALAIMLSNNEGLRTVPFVDGGDGRKIERPGVTIRMRGDKDDKTTLGALAELLREILDWKTIGRWQNCVVSSAGVLNLGQNDDGFPRRFIAVELLGDFEQFPLYHGAADVPGAVNAAFLATLQNTSRAHRNHVFSATAVGVANRLWVAFPQSFSGPAAAPFRLSDGLTSKVPLATTLMGTVAMLVRGQSVVYDVHASSAAVTAGAHIAKVL